MALADPAVAEPQTSVTPADESSPSAQSPVDGLGASGAAADKPVTQKDLDAIRSQLQSRTDKAVGKVSELEQRLADLTAENRTLLQELDLTKKQAQLPDPTIDPVGRARALEQLNTQLVRQQRTERYIEQTLQRTSTELGVEIDRSDKRLNLKAGKEGFLASVAAIKAEVQSKRTESAEVASLRQTLAELEAKVAGGTARFDGGSSGAAVSGQTTGFTAQQISDPKFYQANRVAILADMERRGAFSRKTLATPGRGPDGRFSSS
jgi:uncharacterized protein YceH (UPF0502 family)